MPDIKKDANIDAVKQLAAFKQTKLAEINDSISTQKSRAAVLLSSIRAKRAEFLEAEEQKRLQEEAALRAKKEAELKAQQEKAKEAAPVEKVEEEKPVEAEPVKKPATEKKPKKTEKVANPAGGEFVQETEELLPNGEMRRIYVPPTPEKKPKVQTRVFGQNGYQPPRNNRPQGDFGKPGAPQGKPAYKKTTLENMPQQFPPKPGAQQKGKGGKQNSGNSGKYDDRSNKMNKRDLMKKGYLVDDRISYDEEGEEIVRSYKAPKNRGGGIL